MSSEQQDVGEKFTSGYRYGEGATVIGQAVEFTCHADEAEQVREFLRTHVRTIDTPVAAKTNVSHGSYGQYTRYDVMQHEYAGGGNEGGSWGYCEVLEVKNPPDGRWGIVVHSCTSKDGLVFTEWETIADAQNFFAKHLAISHMATCSLTGFKRIVTCGELMPWFYAIGNEQLIGDYAVPHGLQDDPVFRLGKRFVVFDREGLLSVKTCMGARLFSRKRSAPYYSGHTTEEHCVYRIVYWDDGSMWNEAQAKTEKPRPLEESEEWITEAMGQFRAMLAGKRNEFSINFTDGMQFVGKVKPAKRKDHCAEGTYYAHVLLKGEEKEREGAVDFVPTTECPDVVQYITKACAEGGEEVQRLTVKLDMPKRKGRKWSGVFHTRS